MLHGINTHLILTRRYNINLRLEAHTVVGSLESWQYLVAVRALQIRKEYRVSRRLDQLH